MGFEGLSDVEIIWIVLGGFYAFESFGWLRKGAVWFASMFGGPCRVVRSPLLAGQDLAGPVLLDIFPSARSFLANNWPISISPQGLYSYVAVSSSPMGRASQPGRFLPLEQIETIESEAEAIKINGKDFAIACSVAQAKFVTESLRRILAVAVEERAAAIDDALAKFTDMDAAKRRLEEVDRRASLLSLFSFLLFLHVFLMGPFAYYQFRLHPSSTRLLVGYLVTCFVLWGGCTFLFARAFRAIYPEDLALRRKQVATMSLSIVTAMRAWSHLPRLALSDFHPLAVAAVVCDARVGEAFAEEVLRDVLHPIHPACPDAEAAHRETEEWFRQRLSVPLFKLTERMGYDPEKLTGSPVPEPGSSSYCPRCADQYEVAEGTCASCGDLPLVAFNLPEGALLEAVAKPSDTNAP